MTTAVPALPVKPVRNCRRLSHSATYSDWCASSVGTMYACSLSLSMSKRREARFAELHTGGGVELEDCETHGDGRLETTRIKRSIDAAVEGERIAK